MNAHGTNAALLLLVALASASAEAAATRPLQLAFRPPPPRLAAVGTTRTAPLRPVVGPGLRNNTRAEAVLPRKLGERALQSLLDPPQAELDDSRGAGRLQLHFQRRGNAFRDLNKSYREMCNTVSAKIWEEPNGKRVRFDIAGKPGVGVEIPLR